MRVRQRVRVKICCIQSPAEARLAIEHGADALGLVSAMPSGPGVIAEDLIAELAQTTPRVEVILGTSGDSFAEEVALAAGADGFLAKPISSISAFQATILSFLPAERQPPGFAAFAIEGQQRHGQFRLSGRHRCR